MDNPFTIPFKRVPSPGEVIGPTKSSLFGEIDMLAPESQMTEKVDSFFKAFRNLAGACKAVLKHDGENSKSGEVLQSECRLQSSVDDVVT